MSGKRLGYIRVSTIEQCVDRQLENITLDKKFVDKASGRDVKRPSLEMLLDYAREDDTVFVHSMDRLARNLGDLKKIVNHLIENGATVEFIKENLKFSKNNSAMSLLLLHVMGAFAEFENDFMRERQREGIELAKRRGVYAGRRHKLKREQVEELKTLLITPGLKKSYIAQKLGISRTLLYVYMKKGDSYFDPKVRNASDRAK